MGFFIGFESQLKINIIVRNNKSISYYYIMVLMVSYKGND